MQHIPRTFLGAMALRVARGRRQEQLLAGGIDCMAVERFAAPGEMWTEDRTLLELVEGRTDAEMMVLPADQLIFDLDLLFWNILAVHASWKGAVQAFQMKTWVLDMALRHEDRIAERQCLRDLALLQAALPAAEVQYQRSLVQWHRLWDALLKFRIPDDLHEAIEVIADSEGRSVREQILGYLREAVGKARGCSGAKEEPVWLH